MLEDTEKEMAIHSSTLAWKIPWTKEPDRLQSMGLQRVRHDWATSLTSHQLCTFKNPIFSTHFYLGVRSLVWLLSSPFDFPFSSPGCLYLFPPPSLLYPTLWISLCVLGCGEHLGNWLLAGSLSFWFPLLSSWPPLSPSSLFSSLCNTINISEGSRLWRAHKELITS